MNQIEETTFTVSTVIQIVVYTGGGIGIYYTLKNKVALLKTCIDQMEKKLDDDVKIIHDRIDKTNSKVEEKTSEITKEMKELREEIHKGQLKQEENKNEILKAITNNK